MSISLCLPPGWAHVEFGDLVEHSQNGCGARRGTGTPTVVLRLADVTIEGIVANEGLREIPLSEEDREKYALKRGDLLAFRVNGSPHITGQVACYPGPDGYAYCDHFIRFRLRPDVLLSDLAAYAFRVWPARDQVASGMVSTAGQNTVSQKTYASVRLLLPPILEQQRIVEAIGSYFTRLDDTVATLERVERNLKRYRASVLKSAVEGRLVPTEAALAKQEGRDYEPASVLLERILAERRSRWSESGKKGKYQEPARPDAKDLPDLPEGWCWTTIDSLIWDADYGTSQKCTYETKGPAVLRIPNVQEQSIRLEDLKFATEPDRLDSNGIVRPGDLIFIRTNGSRNLVGRGAVVLDELPAPHYFASYLIRLRVLPVDGLPRWAGFVWHTPMLREQLLAEAASSAGQYNVSMKAATRFVVPLAPVAEQVRILDEVARIGSLAEATITTATAAVERSTRLRRSILQWAFQGKLADQDRNDEPAAALLERIKAERESAKSVKGTRSQRGTGKKQVRA